MIVTDTMMSMQTFTRKMYFNEFRIVNVYVYVYVYVYVVGKM